MVKNINATIDDSIVSKIYFSIDILDPDVAGYFWDNVDQRVDDLVFDVIDDALRGWR